MLERHETFIYQCVHIAISGTPCGCFICGIYNLMKEGIPQLRVLNHIQVRSPFVTTNVLNTVLNFSYDISTISLYQSCMATKYIHNFILCITVGNRLVSFGRTIALLFFFFFKKRPGYCGSVPGTIPLVTSTIYSTRGQKGSPSHGTDNSQSLAQGNHKSHPSCLYSQHLPRPLTPYTKIAACTKVLR